MVFNLNSNEEIEYTIENMRNAWNKVVDVIQKLETAENLKSNKYEMI